MKDITTSRELEELIGELAEEFSERVRSGEKPSVEEYARRYPDAADHIRAILPALALVADGPASADPKEGRLSDPLPAPQNGMLGDFRLLQEIGRGGMGVVYEAEQISLNRRVALKILPFAAALDPRQIRRFRNEALAVAQLDHPNIVDAYGMGCERSVHFYAMRYVEGRTLAQLIEHCRGPRESSSQWDPQDGAAGDASTLARPVRSNPDNTTPCARLSTLRSSRPERFTSVARIGVEIAEALDHAHQQGVIHRDVKPANIIIDHTGKTWVTDFGLASTVIGSALTRTGDVLGTLRFMSPEQALGKRAIVDHRTDIYSLGATLYELMTLAPLFADGERTELLYRIACDTPRRPRRINPSTPEQLETIVLKALAKDPRDRYDTAQEMADDLLRFLDDRPIRARRPSLVQHLAAWSRRHRGFVWLSAALLLLVTVASTLTATLIFAEKKRTETALGQARANHRLAAEQRNLAQQKAREAEMALSEADRQRRFAQSRATEAERQHRRATVHLSIALLLLEQEPRLTQARTWLDSGAADADGMIELAKILLERHPEEREAWKLLAEAYDSAGRHAEALKQFEKYTREYPDLAESHNRLAWFLANSTDESLRDPQRAIQFADRARALAPNDSWFLNTCGVAHYRAGDWHGAMAAFEDSISHGWDDGFNSFFLAMCHWRLGQKAEAQKWYASGIEKQEPALPIAGRELRQIRQEAEHVLNIRGKRGQEE